MDINLKPAAIGLEYSPGQTWDIDIDVLDVFDAPFAIGTRKVTAVLLSAGQVVENMAVGSGITVNANNIKIVRDNTQLTVSGSTATYNPTFDSIAVGLYKLRLFWENAGKDQSLIDFLIDVNEETVTSATGNSSGPIKFVANVGASNVVIRVKEVSDELVAGSVKLSSLNQDVKDYIDAEIRKSNFIFSPGTSDAIKIEGNTITIKNINVVSKQSSILIGLDATYSFTLDGEFGFVKAKNISFTQGGNIMKLEQGVIPAGENKALFFQNYPLLKSESILLYKYGFRWMSSYAEIQSVLDRIYNDQFIFSPKIDSISFSNPNTVIIKDILISKKNYSNFLALAQPYTITVSENFGYILAEGINVSGASGQAIVTLSKGQKAGGFFWNENPIPESKAVLMYTKDGEWYSYYPEIQTAIDLAKRKFSSNSYHLIGDHKITISGEKITFPPLRRVNKKLSWDEMTASITVDLSGKNSYLVAKKIGNINSDVGLLTLTKGLKSFFWQEPIISEVDIIVYKSEGILKSDIPSIQAEIDRYYNQLATKNVQAYDMGVQFDSGATYTQPRAYMNNQKVLKNGFLSDLNVRVGLDCTIILLVMREGITSGKWLTEVSRTEFIVSSGYNEIKGLRIPVKQGDYIAIVNKNISGPSISGKVTSTTIGRIESDVITDINNTIYVTPELKVDSDILFQYTFKVVETTLNDVEKYRNTDYTSYNSYIDGSNTFNSQTGWLTNVSAVATNANVIQLKIKVKTAKTYTFAVGLIDQWGKAVIRKSFTLELSAGVNYKKVNWDIQRGEHLFIKLEGDGNIYFWHSGGSGIGTNFLYSDTPGGTLNYLGNPTYGGGIPFSFETQNNESIFATNALVESLKIDVSNIKSIIDANVLKVKDPVTQKEFEITVSIINGLGVLSTRSLTVNKWLTLGNSITIHPITSFWWGNWGMAASRREKDWVHQLQAKFVSKYGVAPSFLAKNIASEWESNPPACNYSLFNSYFSGNEDLIILKVGENVSYYPTYQNDFETLIDYCKSKAPQARIVVAGTFWVQNEKDEAMRLAAIKKGCIWVKLSHLDIPTNRSSLDAIVYDEAGNPHIVSEGGDIASGVAGHPGDAGMLAIAETIFSVL